MRAWGLAGLIRCITVRQREGGVAVPPPILSRVYQELSNAMLGFNSAMKVATTPFPFPYAQLNVIQVLVPPPAHRTFSSTH